MANNVISDACPIIHLSQIGMFRCFSIFKTVYVPREVYHEVKVCQLPGNREIESDMFEIVDLDSNQKDRSEYYSNKYEISVEDGTVIALTEGLEINLVLTDDLDVRDVLESHKIKPVGSMGVLLRVYRERLITFRDAIQSLDDLLKTSTLYITSRMIENAKHTLMDYDSAQG